MPNKNFITYIIIILTLLTITSCNVSKHLPKGTQLYKGSEYTIEKEKGNKASVKSIKKQLKIFTLPIPNKTIFGFPYRVWLWYKVGEPKKQKGFKYWLRNKVGEAPVLSPFVNVKANVAYFQTYLENKGYFKTFVSGDTTIKGYKVTTKYKITLGMPYKINSFTWLLDSSSTIAKDIVQLPPKENYVKINEQYDLANIIAERSRADIFLKSIGYYYFSPDHIKALVDSGKNKNKVDIYFRLKPEMPLAASIPQTIRTITLFPNYSLLKPLTDTGKTEMLYVNGIYIRDTVHNIKPEALTPMVTYKSGELYTIREQNSTLNRFINMGVFKFVKSRYKNDGDSINPHYLDVNYYLTQLPKKTVQAEIGTFTKSNSYSGAQVSLTWRNRNYLKGAEQLSYKGYGAYEISSNDSLKGHNNYRLGGEISIVFPRFVAPFKIKENNYFPPRTKFSFGYEWFRRQALYTKNFYRVQYDVTWKKKINIENTFSPISITFNTTSSFSNQYQKLVDSVPALQISNIPEIIMGSFYNYTFHSINPNATNIFYFNANIDAAGNIVGLFNKSSAPYSSKILGAYYSQYIKADLDFRYNRKLNDQTYWSNRIIVGVGFPYGNSSFLPFTKQFIIGGSSSIRGFQPRQLGPGRVRADALQQLYLPQVGGDYKLELNTELRFPLFSILKGAVFVDAGNTWTRDTILYGKAAQFNSHFLKDIAVSGGFGFRLDIGIFIVRLDIAAPLRKPYLPRGQEWAIKDIAPFNSIWRNENLVYNIGIGYPF